MGGNHKKNIRAEKAKVKLKGAKLPKGLNVTKTEFKVRKIVMRGQLQNYVEGERQVNLKETLSRLKHHSSSYRLDALRGIRDMLAARNLTVFAHLNELMQSVAAICLDIEKEPRREAVKTMDKILETLTIEQITPFFHVLSSYLRCAMTHIQPSIQEDSLLLLDVLLQHVPHLVTTHSDKILQNFLEMISKVRSGGENLSRKLTVTLEGSQKQTTTAVKWRTQVLNRLHGMLRILAEMNATKSGQAARQANVHTFSGKQPQYYPLKPVATNGVESSVPSILQQTRSYATEETGVNVVGGRPTIKLHSYLQHLMPLLFESWLEVCPQKTPKTSTFFMLSLEDAETLRVVLEIMKVLWALVDQHEAEVLTDELSSWLRQEYGHTFNANFMLSAFPYQQKPLGKAEKNATKAGGKSKKTADPDPHCVQQNISIAFLMSRFNSSDFSENSEHFAKLLKYLTDLVGHLSGPGYVSEDHHEPLAVALRAYLYENGEAVRQLHPEFSGDLLRATLKAFLANEISPKNGASEHVLLTLCYIGKCQKLMASIGSHEFDEFFAQAPRLLLKPSISQVTLLALTELGKQKNERFLQALRAQVLDIIANIQSIQVLGSVNAFEGKKHIMNVFYWTKGCGQWSDAESRQITEKLKDSITDKRIVQYFDYVLL